MTKYKTNAQKLKFFNDAKAARMPKADRGVIMQARTTPGEIYDPNPNEPIPHSPDTMYTNTTAGELANLGFTPSTVPTYTNTTKGEISPVKPKNPSRMSYTQKKGGSIKRRKK